MLGSLYSGTFLWVQGVWDLRIQVNDKDFGLKLCREKHLSPCPLESLAPHQMVGKYPQLSFHPNIAVHSSTNWVSTFEAHLTRS